MWDALFKQRLQSFAVSKDALAEDSAALVKDKPSVRAVCFAKAHSLSPRRPAHPDRTALLAAPAAARSCLFRARALSMS